MVQRIAGCLMLKNESQRIMVTLKTLQGFITGLIVFDTGSTDDTIKIVQDWCDENKIPLHLKQGVFVDFSASRNVLLDFADTIEGYDFLLSLDCNDELQNGPKLLEECERFSKMPEKVFMVRQRWLSGTFINKYLNARLTKVNHGWRYKKRVHEYLAPPDGAILNRPNVSEEVVLYQNRNDDDDKTHRRFVRDKAFLSEDVKEYGDSRDIFYLAQTLSGLGEYDEALAMYHRRSEILEGFWEERFHSYLRSAELYITKKNDLDTAIANYIKAAMIDFRAEPLVALGKIYRERQDYMLSYMFLSAACKLDYPHSNILFVAERDYTFERWQQLSIVCYYVNKFTEGREALKMARQMNQDMEAHDKNEEFYIKAAEAKTPETVLFATEEMPPELAEIGDNFIAEGKQAIINKDLDMTIIKFLQAFQLSRNICPLLILAEYCRCVNANGLAYCLTKMCCSMEEPTTLPKNDKEYSYKRWHLLGILGYHVGRFKEGKEACLKALKAAQNISLDRSNLKFYLDREKSKIADVAPSVAPSVSPSVAPSEKKETISQYKEHRIPELMALNPKMNIRQATAKAQLEWKLSKK